MDKKGLALHILLIAAASTATAAQRDYIAVVGSSTVYPFATVVAEKFGKTTRFKTPKVESTGSGGGLKLFCGGVGTNHPDVTNASRRIKKSEVETCRKNGVNDIVEVVNAGKLSNISQQLKILALAGLIERRRDRKQILYSLRDPRIQDMIEFFRAQFLAPQVKRRS